MEDGAIVGPFAGRLAELFILGDGNPSVAALAAATDNPMGLRHGDLTDPSQEELELFRRGLGRLRQWVAAPMTAVDMRDASALLFSWLFDRTPILVDLARRYGVQLWLPGMSGQAARYEAAVLQSGAVAMIQGSRGPESPMGFSWTPLEEWRQQPMFHAQGEPISAERFVKFVRNKLGGAHFDEEDRAQWQRQLLEVVGGLRLGGEPALEFQMRNAVEQVLLAASTSRLTTLTGAE